VILRSTVFVLLAALTVAGCGRAPGTPDDVMSRERFIEANVALRQIDRTDPAADSLRAVVMQERDIGEGDLERFVQARDSRPGELAAIWQEIHERLAEAQLPPEPITDVDGASEALPSDEASSVAPPTPVTDSDAVSPRPPTSRPERATRIGPLPVPDTIQ